ncbi:MAG: hypothetical protein HC875_21185 [Anaerolineales bacterium]|nr:hypothetical protein [Anaerolineales bacterium]
MRVDAVGNKFELAAGTLHYQKLALPGLLLVGLVLRLWHIDGALWYDEAFSAWLAGLPVGQLIEAARGDVHPPTYYLLLAAVTRLTGHSEAALRLPSVLAGLGTIYMVFRLARSLGLSERAALLAGAICTLSPFAIYYSQEPGPTAC